MARPEVEEDEYNSYESQESASESASFEEEVRQSSGSSNETGRSYGKRKSTKPRYADLGFHRYSGKHSSRLPKYIPTSHYPSDVRKRPVFDEAIFRMMLRSPLMMEPKQGSTRFLGQRRQYPEKAPLHCISKRFEWYSSPQGSDGHKGLSLQNIERMIQDTFDASCSKAAARKVFARIDIQNSGFVSYDDFVSYLSLSWTEICQLAEDLLSVLFSKGDSESDEKHAYGVLAPSYRGEKSYLSAWSA